MHSNTRSYADSSFSLTPSTQFLSGKSARPSKYTQNPASVYHLLYYHLDRRPVIAYVCSCTCLFTGLPASTLSLCLHTVYRNTVVRKGLLECKSDCVRSAISFQEKANGLTIIYRTVQHLASLPTLVTSLPFP